MFLVGYKIVEFLKLWRSFELTGKTYCVFSLKTVIVVMLPQIFQYIVKVLSCPFAISVVAIVMVCLFQEFIFGNTCEM